MDKHVNTCIHGKLSNPLIQCHDSARNRHEAQSDWHHSLLFVVHDAIGPASRQSIAPRVHWIHFHNITVLQVCEVRMQHMYREFWHLFMNPNFGLSTGTPKNPSHAPIGDQSWQVAPVKSTSDITPRAVMHHCP